MSNQSFKYRDLSFESMGSNEYLVIACDISASIGYKPNDVFPCDPRITAAYSVRVAIMELLAVKAEPFLLVSLCGNEWEDTGKQFNVGILKELKSAGYPDLPINGSTEENMETTMSSIGVTLLGRSQKESLLINQSKTEQICYQCGYPYLGPDVLAHEENIPTYDDIKFLHTLYPKISEIVPIGSKGSINEAYQIAEANQLEFIPTESEEVNHIGGLTAGPATSFLVIGDEDVMDQLQERFKFVMKIGRLN